MELKLVGPTSSQAMAINWLEVQTLHGNFVIMPGHAPMVVLLAHNKEVTMELEDGSTTLMTIAGGILEVTRTSLTLLLTHE
jgi:F0F1-type ATP synthase epsilon subunit